MPWRSRRVKSAQRRRASAYAWFRCRAPSVFDAQDAAYREVGAAASGHARGVAVEAGVTGLWWRYVGSDGRVVGIDHFGASGKAPELFKNFGFTAEHVLEP